MNDVDTVMAVFDAYIAQDRAVVEELISEELEFTSPQDDHISKAEYLERCFPTAERLAWQRIVRVIDIGDGDVGLLYEYELKSGGTYRNVEVITVAQGQVREIQVFFGGQV